MFASPTLRGKVHDKLMADSLLITKKCTLLTDLGFYGWKLSEAAVIMPHKKPKNKPLSKLQKVQNRLLSRERVQIENVFAHVKILRIVKDRIRTYIEETKNTVFTIAVALYNFRRMFALKRKVIYL